MLAFSEIEQKKLSISHNDYESGRKVVKKAESDYNVLVVGKESPPRSLITNAYDRKENLGSNKDNKVSPLRNAPSKTSLPSSQRKNTYDRMEQDLMRFKQDNQGRN